MTKILGISGSLRKASFNTGLMRAAAENLPDDVKFDTATLHGIPLYDGDIEKESGIPPAVTVLKQQVMAADGVILFTPEYNNSIPGVFKNAIDWLSRPSADIAKVFRNRPFALAGASRFDRKKNMLPSGAHCGAVSFFPVVNVNCFGDETP